MMVINLQLKGGSWREARLSSDVLLKRLGISEKAHSLSSELSGGMKRRLQLACALAGGANVLVLDEPTSGLDVETRRELWDLLLVSLLPLYSTQEAFFFNLPCNKIL